VKRALLILAVVAVAGGFVVLAGGTGSTTGTPTYRVQLDNAFGLVSGADVKVAGVRAGTIGSFALDKNNKALVKINITRGGFGTFHTDAFCQSRPQSLIGEYFIDCDPGRTGPALKDGAEIPVTHTASTVPPDLVQGVLRLPYRQRLALIIDELGAGVAARGADLNATIRRAVPALRETDRVLSVLRDQSATIRDLTRNADTVVTALARSHRDVGRFVTSADQAAVDTAERSSAVQASFSKLPGFLEQLQPTMASLGRVADRQTPALANLRAAAPGITRFFTDLAPFARASTPALTALGKASVTGRQAVVAAKPTISLLRAFTVQTPELANNLNIVLHDIDDRSRATENNPNVPKQTGVSGPAGYTGLEALLMYVYNQSLAVNSFDQNGHLLRVNAFPSECGAYTDAYTLVAKLKNDPSFKHCEAWLGPNQPGINQPDPSTAYPAGKGPAFGTASAAARRATPARATATDPAAHLTAPAAQPSSGALGLLNYLVRP
jgi:virulence factor Mce-like protein